MGEIYCRTLCLSENLFKLSSQLWPIVACENKSIVSHNEKNGRLYAAHARSANK